MSLIDQISEAIAQMESGGDPNALSYRNNNPGNLRSWGSNPIVNGYAKFPTMEAGWAALRQQVNLNIGRGLTLYEFFGGKPNVYGGYAPNADPPNDARHYAVFVASRIGLDPSIPLNSIPGSSPPNPKLPRPPRTDRG